MGEGLAIGQGQIEGQALAVAAPSRACRPCRPWPW